MKKRLRKKYTKMLGFVPLAGFAHQSSYQLPTPGLLATGHSLYLVTPDGVFVVDSKKPKRVPR